MIQTRTENSTAKPSSAVSERRTAWNLVLWNLDHARAKAHDAARVAAISESDPDIVVLTETHDRIRPGGEGWRRWRRTLSSAAGELVGAPESRP